MVTKHILMNLNCSVLKTTGFIGKKWTLLIFLELYKGEKKWKRFNELKKNLSDITPKVLSQRLKEMCSNGLVKKKVNTSVVPHSSSYSLTPCGKDLFRITKQCKEWVLKWKAKNELCSETDCINCQF